MFKLLYRLVEKVKDVFTFGIFIQFLASTIAICNTLLNMVLVSHFLFFLHLIYISCWLKDFRVHRYDDDILTTSNAILTVLILLFRKRSNVAGIIWSKAPLPTCHWIRVCFQGVSVGDACYMLKWYNCNEQKKRSLYYRLFKGPKDIQYSQ